MYDSTATTGPRAVLQPLADDHDGEPPWIVHQPEGSGTGKPEEVFQAILSNYAETAAVGDMRMWSVDFEVNGTIHTYVQAS